MLKNLSSFCIGCEKDLPISHFYLNSKRLPRPRCKVCHIKQSESVKHLRKQSIKEKLRENFLMKEYNLSPRDYNLLVINQNGRCKICGAHQSGLKEVLCVDHCHSTRRIRGLLCSECNTGLGKFKDSTELLNKAIMYLIQTEKIKHG